MCDLTTKWILESAQSLACALLYWYYVLWLGSGELLIPWSERGLRRSEGSGTPIDDPLGEGSNLLALPIASSGERITHFQNEKELKRSGVGPKVQTGAWPAQIRARRCNA